MKYLIIIAVLLGTAACRQSGDTLFLGVKHVYKKQTNG